LTDSPWFWVYVFSTAAALALFVMGGKYEHRQGHIEDEYRFGTRTLARPAADASSGASASVPTSGATIPENAPLAGGPQPPTHELLISLGPLRFAAIAVMIISCIALQLQLLWNRRHRPAAAKHAANGK
jgi:hypothetical protein